MQFISNYKLDFPEAIQALTNAYNNAQARRTRLADENTILSIGIMGQVKAGKSSFLNSLLFDGQALLPEAATPKTANLTRIRYADNYSFTAHFYSPKDWAEIEKQAASDTQDERTKAAQELVNSAHNSGENIPALLAQGKIAISASSEAELLGKLNEYTGSDGRLTALVAETELALPVDKLKNIEIVDTPGMNDPVRSRTEKTREYMARCDVVFFLSRASQFLDASDQDLIASQLPQNGIKRLIVVGAQFDMAVLDDGFNRQSLEICTTRLQQRLSAHAAKIFSDLAQMNTQRGKNKVAELLTGLDAPIFSSTHAWQIAHTPQEIWPKHVQHTAKEMQDLAEFSWKSELTPQDWENLANWQPLTAALEAARAEKDSILAAQRAGLEKDLAETEAYLKQQLSDQASTRKRILETKDLHSLAEQEKHQQEQLNGISSLLITYLRNTVEQTQQRQQDLLAEINASAQRASNLQEHTGYKTSRHTYSTSTWYKPWTWGSTESYSTTTSYKYLMVDDALENLRFYVQSTRLQMLAAFDDLIAPKTVSAGLRRELLSQINLENTDFDAKGLREIIESSLQNLVLPQLDFPEPDLSSLFDGFSGKITSNSDMDRLRSQLSETVNQINQHLIQQLGQAVTEASDQLNTIAEQLHQLLTQRLASEIERLRSDMADKEQQLERLNKLIDYLV